MCLFLLGHHQVCHSERYMTLCYELETYDTFQLQAKIYSYNLFPVLSYNPLLLQEPFDLFVSFLLFPRVYSGIHRVVKCSIYEFHFD